MPTIAHRKENPVLEVPTDVNLNFGGLVGQRIDANLKNWLMTAPESNPAMLGILRSPDRTPERDLVPWAGEFAGKFLISAVQALRLIDTAADRTQADETQADEAHQKTKKFVADLISCQGDDGYLGPWSSGRRLTGKTVSGEHKLWDLWGHYHCMLGLFLWYKYSDDSTALSACRKSADMLCDFFLDGDNRIVDAGAEEMNQAIIHIFCLLYEETGHERYLKMARRIEEEWQTPPSGDYLRTALSGKEFFEGPKPRWESLPDVQGICELYFITGKEEYRTAFEAIWWSITKLDRHNTGGFSSGEKATGNPYHQAAIETCCTIAWMALTEDFLRLTGDSRAADELELSLYSAVLGAQSHSGRWWTYDTPMDGERKASAHHIVFQARAGSSELNCCSVNGPRGLVMLSEWALMTSNDLLFLNYYGSGNIEIILPSGEKICIEIVTQYPMDDNVHLNVVTDSDNPLTLNLRIPSWSRRTEITVDGSAISGIIPGHYLPITRSWSKTAQIDISFDMSTRLWVGEAEVEGKISLYHGPVLMAYDPRFDIYDPFELPELDPSIPSTPVECFIGGPSPWILRRFTTSEGDNITLCDFASAGAEGHSYISWLPGHRIAPAQFSRDNPQRAVWMD